MKISKRVQILAAIVGSGIVVASSACGVDSTAPAPKASTPERISGFVPSAANLELVGVKDGVYKFTFDPREAQVLALGPNRLELPAGSICALGVSGYGSSLWNRGCNPERKSVTITVTIKNASSDNPSVDFEPAMRFNPDTKVMLYFYVPRVTRDDAKDWIITYCPTASSRGRSSSSASTSGNAACINEALTDSSLTTYVDYRASVLFRRIKHFSGYVVAD
jgi:hypothetical protein